MTDPVSALSSILLVFFTALTLLVVRRQASYARQTNAIPVLVEFFREFRDQEFKKHQRFIYLELDKCSPKDGIEGLPSEPKIHVQVVSAYFDNLGCLVANRIVDERTVLSFTGIPVEKTWIALSPFVKREREIRNNPTYLRMFEDLARRSKEMPQTTIVDALTREYPVSDAVSSLAATVPDASKPDDARSST